MHRFVAVPVVSLLVAALVACGGGDRNAGLVGTVASEEAKGWRSVVRIEEAGTADGERLFVEAERTGLERLWSDLYVPAELLPDVDFAEEIVVVAGYHVSSSCREDFVSAVEVDVEVREIHVVVTSPYAPDTTCTADQYGVLRVVAIDRDLLPEVPFAVTWPGLDPVRVTNP